MRFLLYLARPRFQPVCAKAALFFLAICCAALPGLAEKAADLKPQGYVNDFARVLDAQAAQQLTTLCEEVDNAAHAQIAVVTVHSLDGVPIDMFANDLFTKWGVGQKGTDRGVMILLAVSDHRYRIEVGYGLEPVLTDGLVGRFGREVVPALRAGDYSGAVLQLTADVAGAIAQSRGFKLARPLAKVNPDAGQGSQPGSNSVFPIIIMLAILGFGLLGSFGSRSGLRGGGWWGGPWIGGGFGGFGGFGGGGFGGGGGLGGFGGGMSGGGGASGGW
ncbi:MAG TPA: TPM domain-containing protein [Terriglobia bacterium]|nr:TPM domain-containing protein [Terriglobia bacterium]